MLIISEKEMQLLAEAIRLTHAKRSKSDSPVCGNDKFGWIPTNNSKPLYLCRVLVFRPKTKSVIIAARQYNMDGYLDDDGMFYMSREITHWMPLPGEPDSE